MAGGADTNNVVYGDDVRHSAQSGDEEILTIDWSLKVSTNVENRSVPFFAFSIQSI